MDLFHAMLAYRRVVELQSFSAAAADLRLTPAAVSKQIAALEERLHCKLLHRTTRRLAMTPEGEAYYARCVQILDDVEEAERELAPDAGVPRGKLRVNGPAAFGALHLSPLVPAMLERWPQLELEISLTDRFIDLVAEGVDVAVRIAPVLPDSASLVAQRLASSEVVFCASPAYLRRRGVPSTAADVADHDCVRYSGSLDQRGWQFTGPEGEALVRASGRLVVDSGLLLRDALLGSAGLGLLPSFYVAEELADGRLVRVLRDHEAPPVHVHAVYLRSKHTSPRVRHFVQLLRAHFSAASWALPTATG
ncbi:LysR family transcriptional regulator [Vulgatibacter sp.]|uniref:LysR family transcriptional regulator n=1 Tax=Vulgatibacter sp. TaxID=1971226 RepID=UPI00356AC592